VYNGDDCISIASEERDANFKIMVRVLLRMRIGEIHV
jgi:hypothetical protein